MTTEAIWSSFKDQLYGFIRNRVNQPEVAEDILQDVFVKIHLGLEKVADQRKLTSWVYQVTRNAIIDYYRKKKLPLSDQEIEISLPEGEDNLNTGFESCLYGFAKTLPEKYKDALEKVEFGKMSQKEYAEKLGISYTGAKSRVQRAREQLKQHLLDCCVKEVDAYGNVIEKGDCACDF